MMSEYKVIGFTGTREGMTPEQAATVEVLLDSILPERVHHGDCVGADAEFHLMADDRDIPIWVHPPNRDGLRAFMQSGVRVNYEPKGLLIRNRDIVASVEMMIATPLTRVEDDRSGTWMTIRYAKAVHRDLTIVYPNGEHGDFRSPTSP